MPAPIDLLADELQAFQNAFRAKIGPEIAALMQAAEEELRAEGAGAAALGPGAPAPDATLPDQAGRPVALRPAPGEGPTIAVFYRGGWCPYCNLTLRAYQRRLPDLTAAGVRLIAISPQTPDASLGTAEKNDLAFPVLSDRGSAVAEAFGVAFALPAALRALYTRFGHALPETNGTSDWRLPIPATFVIGTDGRIALAHVDLRYQVRLEPEDAIAAAVRLARAEAVT